MIKEMHTEMLKQLKSYYPPGTRVMLIRMNDPYTKLQPGTKGTVTGVDDIGTIHVNWDSGSSLGIAFGKDECRKIGGQNMNEKIKEQILIIRDSGVTNMFDVNRVQHEANCLGFYELVLYLKENKDEYGRFILTGETS